MSRIPIAGPLPPLPNEIHRGRCKPCPSAPGREPDPFSVEFKAGSRTLQIASTFPCAWRREKLCKGYCDYLGITDADLRVMSVADARAVLEEEERKR